ncbi:MAG: RNA methyltransferase [Vampirovibrionales bacterium]|nr:RNA methyltransferase [Vampirovibrionales bacterium]
MSFNETPASELTADYCQLKAWLSLQNLGKEVLLPKSAMRWLQTLQTSKGRQASEILIIEGIHAIQEASAGGLDILLCFSERRFDPSWLGESLGAKILPKLVCIPRKDMTRLATTETPPVCLALIKKPKTPAMPAVFEQDYAVKPPCLLILDSLQDPGNVGTLIRSAVAFGLSGIISTKTTVDIFSPKVIRSSAGLVFRLPVVPTDYDLEGIMGQCPSSSRFWLTTSHATSPDGEKTHSLHPGIWLETAHSNTQWDVLILGNEGAGLSKRDGQSSKPLQAQWLQIPTTPACESLNVAVAGSILMASRYQALG